MIVQQNREKNNVAIFYPICFSIGLMLLTAGRANFLVVDCFQITSPLCSSLVLLTHPWKHHSEQKTGYPAIWIWFLSICIKKGIVLQHLPYFSSVESSEEYFHFLERLSDYRVVAESFISSDILYCYRYWLGICLSFPISQFDFLE